MYGEEGGSPFPLFVCVCVHICVCVCAHVCTYVEEESLKWVLPAGLLS